MSLFAWLVEQGRVALPKGCQVHVLYADTRQELPPLHFAAMSMLDECRRRGFKARSVCAKMEHRFWTYILGRGVPSPNNGTLRWCTSKIKVEPMTQALEDLRRQIGPDEKLLMLTGVRLGESAARDNRIAVSCTKDGGECGQGWFQRMTVKPKGDLAAIDTLAPILHWRVCHVWDWLVQADIEYDFPTMQVAEAYSMTESIESGDEPISTRTGCIGCPLVSTQDTALARVIQQPQWAYLAPLQKIRRIHGEIRKPEHRLRQPGGERRKNGTLCKNQNRMGPLKLESRLMFLGQLLEIQDEVNQAAIAQTRPQISIVSPDEELFIRVSIGNETWPQGWSGNEPGAEEMIPATYADGSVQPLLF